MSTERRLQDVVVSTLGIEPDLYRENLKVGDIEQWDSVAQFDLLMAIEKEFNVSFSSEQLTELTSLEEIRHFLQTARGV